MTIVLSRRATLLLLLGATDVIYGTALLAANAAGFTNRWWTTARWWPAAQGELLSIDILWWGIVWIGVGLMLMTGIAVRTDKHLFAAEMLLKSIWGLGALYWAFTTSSPGLWGPAATYVGLSALILLAAGWTEPPKIEPLPPPPLLPTERPPDDPPPADAA